MHSVLVKSEYFSGTFSLHPPQTQHPNTSSHTKSISGLPHSLHLFLSASSPSTLSPGSNGPALFRCSLRSVCSRSHSLAVMCFGFPASGTPDFSAALNGSSSVVMNPPFVFVMSLML